ncbi:MAG: hypothetical protein LBQ92_03800, partial [Propionibacteriaceae bacterium]|nr:hypothetical protein [Propionibacteriaceae bacterium]
MQFAKECRISSRFTSPSRGIHSRIHGRIRPALACATAALLLAACTTSDQPGPVETQPQAIIDSWASVVPDFSTAPQVSSWECPGEFTGIYGNVTRDPDIISVICMSDDEEVLPTTLMAYSISQNKEVWQLPPEDDFSFPIDAIAIDLGNGRWAIGICNPETDACDISTGVAIVDSNTGKITDRVFPELEQPKTDEVVEMTGEGVTYAGD